MVQEHFYEVNVKWRSGRIGELSSPVLDKHIECATPPEFANGVAGIWSPEHLYAAAINSCYMATFLAIAENFKLPFVAFECKTLCRLAMVDGKFLITNATISPTVTLEDATVAIDKTKRVLEKAKASCLVTNSINTDITLDVKIR